MMWCHVSGASLSCSLQDIAAGQPTSHPEHYIHAIADISLVSADGAFLNRMVPCAVHCNNVHIASHDINSTNTLYICIM